MEISPISRGEVAAPVAAPTVPAEKASENREVIQAVKAVNGAALLGQDNELMFQMDRNTQRVVTRVVNRKTGDVVAQVPSEYVLRLAEDIRQAQRLG
jgi:flagellar protein FlaG